MCVRERKRLGDCGMREYRENERGKERTVERKKEHV